MLILRRFRGIEQATSTLQTATVFRQAKELSALIDSLARQTQRFIDSRVKIRHGPGLQASDRDFAGH
jgi:hypothetical protein